MPGVDPSCGNSVVVINLATGLLEKTILIGSEPNKLAISDDGQYLYVALDGAGAVGRIGLASQSLGSQFTLGSSGFDGPYYVDDLLVLPGLPTPSRSLDATSAAAPVTRVWRSTTMGLCSGRTRPQSMRKAT